MKRILIPFILGLLWMHNVSAAIPDASHYWAEVLQQYVDDKGRIDFRGLSENRAGLDAYVDYIGKVSPELTPEVFPTHEHRIAHYINSYNALAMQGILNKDLPDSLGGFTKLSFFVFQQFNVGGKQMSLRSYENDVIRAAGEERVHFVLNCMVVSCPRLPTTPFTAEGLESALDQEARLFFNEARNLHRDDVKQRVNLSEIIDFYPEDFLAKQPTLIAYINQYIDDPVPASYDVDFIDYDWTVNHQPRVSE